MSLSLSDSSSAENAMEQLATGLNKAAETMASTEAGTEAAPGVGETEDGGQAGANILLVKRRKIGVKTYHC